MSHLAFGKAHVAAARRDERPGTRYMNRRQGKE
jgi:hypothetical protein